MASSFAGLTLFASGPHRFRMDRVGRLVRGPFATALEIPVSTDEGVLELRIFQQGRLVATTDGALRALVETIRSHAEAGLTGTLIDHHAGAYPGMTLVRFEPGSRVDRGRVVSMRYEAMYLRFGAF